MHGSGPCSGVPHMEGEVHEAHPCYRHLTSDICAKCPDPAREEPEMAFAQGNTPGTARFPRGGKKALWDEDLRAGKNRASA